MAYINFPSPTPVFPALPTLGWNVKKTPVWSATTALSVSGREKRAARQCFPVWEFELTYEFLRERTQNNPIYFPNSPYTELEQISQLFLACLGSYGEFYFEDPDDSTRAGMAIGTGDGGTTAWPVYIPYPSTQRYLTVFSAMPGAIKRVTAVYLNGSPQPAGSFSWADVTLTLTTPPPAGANVTADLEFYYRCHFSDDLQTYEQFFKNIWAYPSCKFSSVKP